jgi:transcription-repair coupling factor (superfamily II helicase)
MLGFVAGEYDVLCATSIVESGLDIPAANTIIIDRADLFGLSQLYQLRGRVGRSSERAYCYLLVPSDARLSSEARARISALEQYTELGSGFHVATMDMELRGAGELLGADQSGFVARVGFDLFAQMLEEATADLQGETYIADVDPELSIDVEAFLPETYIDDIGVRLSLYKRFALAQNDDDIERINRELEDRFGPPPEQARRFAEVMRLKTDLRRLRALGLSASSQTATLHLRDDTPLSGARLVPFVAQSGGLYHLSPDGRLTRRLAKGSREDSGLSHADRMLDELSQLVD